MVGQRRWKTPPDPAEKHWFKVRIEECLSWKAPSTQGNPTARGHQNGSFLCCSDEDRELLDSSPLMQLMKNSSGQVWLYLVLPARLR